VHPTVSGDDVADLADLQGKGRIFKGFLHLSVMKPFKIATFLVGGTV
jgi:hypothetical protein